MTPGKPSWEPKKGLAVGKGATVQQFVATVGNDKLEIDVAAWGESHLKVNGREIARITMPRTGARPFTISRRRPSATCRRTPSNPQEKGSPI